jgi:hypothetical protein
LELRIFYPRLTEKSMAPSSEPGSDQAGVLQPEVPVKASKQHVVRRNNRLIDPVDRISEILFGLIMALTFTCTISVIDSGKEDVRDMLVGAVGCNIAWGLVDAVMFILGEMARRGYGARILKFIKGSGDPEKSRAFIADALPPVLPKVLSEEDMELLRKRLLDLPESEMKVRVGWTDIKTAFGIFLLVFLSTFPVALPFVFIESAWLALRVSNGVAILLMFIAGWMLAGHGGYNKWLMALSMTILGVSLVLLTIALGG